MPPRKPNYGFERMERERIKANKNAMKASAKREERERARAAANPDEADSPPETEES